ncbi:hypothetical protein TNCV_4513541 [Trichonephila clavipes]|nr:hypothetical protein TNCV_4513541 [Trichonephila clavipes]
MNRKLYNFITPEYVPHDHHHRGEDIPDELQIQQRQSATCPDVWRILLCGSHLSVPTDLMDRIDTREISNIPPNRSLPKLNLETKEAMGTFSAC